MGFSYTDNYIKWLKENTFEDKISSNTYRMTFPFLDINNTMTEIYIIEKKGKYIITDNGYTFSELELIGFDFKSKRREKILSNILNNYTVALDKDNNMYIECTRETLALKKHLLIQCMIKISDLSHLSTHNIKTLFNEEVEKFLFDNDIRFNKDIAFNGKSKLQSNYDFCIGRSKRAPERIVKLINSIDATQVKSVIFSWEDIRENRDPDTKLITIINDTSKKVSQDNINAFNEYDINTMLWSEREKHVPELAA